jgi:adenylate cyclase
MLKTFFRSINRQHFKSELKPERNTFNSASPEKDSKRGRAFFTNLLKFPGEFEIKNHRIFSALSGHPEMKRIFIFFAPAEAKIGDKHYNAEGFLAIIRESDISLQQIYKQALNSSSSKHYKRSFSLAKFSDFRHFNQFFNPTGKLTEDQNKIVLTEPFPTEILSQLICAHTYYPFYLQKICKNLPLLKISVKKNELSPPLEQYSNLLTNLCLVFAIISGIIFLRLYLFGYDLPFRIRGKMLLSIVVASLLPVAGLFALSAYYQNFMQEIIEFEVENNLKQEAERFSFFSSDYIARLENQLSELYNKFQRLTIPEQLLLLKEWQKTQPITTALTRLKRNNNEINYDPDPKYAATSFELQMSELLFTSIENSFGLKNASGLKNYGTTGKTNFKIKVIGPFMADIGMLHNSTTGNLNTLYALLPIMPLDKNATEIESIYFFKYSMPKLLENILKDEPQFLKRRQESGFEIESCFVPLRHKKEPPNLKDSFATKGFDLELIKDKISKTARFRSNNTWIIRQGIHRIIYATYSYTMQSVYIQVATRKSASEFNFIPSTSVISFYFIAVCICIFLLLGQFFVDPIVLLQKATEEIAQGNFTVRLFATSKDEFNRVFTAFNQMTEQLDQRKKLTSFLSKDVLEEIYADNEILAPGGEKANVCIVFCSVPEIKTLNPTTEAEKIISCLDQLTRVADEVSRKNDGVIDKIIEDTLMLVFRQTDAGDTHVKSACKAALEIKNTLLESKTPIEIIAGIASGKAVSGKIGSEHGKMDFTVIGNPVNLAARLKAKASMATTTGILVCPQTIRSLKGAARLNFIARIEIKGRSRTFPLYELLELRKH